MSRIEEWIIRRWSGGRIIVGSLALAAAGVSPLVLYVLFGPSDGNPIGLGLLAVPGDAFRGCRCARRSSKTRRPVLFIGEIARHVQDFGCARSTLCRVRGCGRKGVREIRANGANGEPERVARIFLGRRRYLRSAWACAAVSILVSRNRSVSRKALLSSLLSL